MSMMLDAMYLPERNPLCSSRQNFWANGVMISLSGEAMMRLSVLTTEIGRRLAGV